jgi:hypothetical protein
MKKAEETTARRRAVVWTAINPLSLRPGMVESRRNKKRSGFKSPLLFLISAHQRFPPLRQNLERGSIHGENHRQFLKNQKGNSVNSVLHYAEGVMGIRTIPTF